MFGTLGVPEIVIVCVVLLLIFGPKRVPALAKGLGQSIREFRTGIKEGTEEQ